METPKPPFGNPPLSEWRKGCRIVDLWELAQQMNCEQCSSLLDLNRTTLETRAGLASVLYIVCQCGVTNKVHTSKKQTIAKTTTAYFINIQASISVQHYCRISAEQACKFLNELGIPATEEVFDTTDQVSKTLCPVETITQLEPVATCQETRSVFKIENKADFCKHPPVDTMDLLECASTDVLFSGKAPGAWADMGTDDLMQHINTKRLVDEKGSAEEFQEAWQAELHSVTSDNKEENVEDKAGTLDQSKDLPLTETAIKTEVQACMHNPLELEGTEECKVRCEVEDGGTEWNETNKKSGEAEFGESPSSCDTRAAVTGTTAHGIGDIDICLSEPAQCYGFLSHLPNDDNSSGDQYIPPSDISSDESELELLGSENLPIQSSAKRKQEADKYARNLGLCGGSSSSGPTLLEDLSVSSLPGEHCKRTRASCSSRPEVTVHIAKNTHEKRMWNKQNCCKFCKKLSTNLTKHILLVHKLEPEVMLILSKPKGSKERSHMLEKLRNYGNYVHNCNVLKTGSGVLIPWRSPSVEVDPAQYVPCEFCLGFFLKDDLWRHMQTCSFKENTIRRRKVIATAKHLLPADGICSKGLKEHIFSSMCPDEYMVVARNDSLIVSFGEKLYQTMGHGKCKHRYIKQRLRQLARFLVEARKQRSEISTLQSCIDPGKFVSVISAIRKLCGYSSLDNSYSNPSLALKLGHSLKHCCTMLRNAALIKGDTCLESKAKDFYVAIDQGAISDFKGMSLEEIHINMEFDKSEVEESNMETNETNISLVSAETNVLPPMRMDGTVSDTTSLEASQNNATSVKYVSKKYAINSLKKKDFLSSDQSHEDNGSSILSSTSHSQQAKPPAASIFRFRARKSNTESFIVNDVCAPFKCSECGARFGLQKALSRHKNLHANERTIIHKFHNPEEIQNKGKDKSCKKFNACSQEKNDLSQNICDQFVKKVVSCQEGSSPSSKVSVMHRNESEDMLNGDSCDETKKVAEKQNDHCKDCNDGERFFKCSKCHAAFDTSSALEDHFKFHTDHRLFSWQDCSANIHKDKYLKCHGSRIHRNKRTFSCPDCSVTVTSASSLKNHMRTHTGEKPFKCEVCEKMYAEKSNLRTHMRTHSGNLPHVCPDCGKAFAFPSRLSMHRHTVHSGQRPYSCQECRAAFPTISNLNLHMRVHTDKRYFACEICKKTFRQSGHLNRHIEEHKSGKTFLCQDCGKTFPNKEYFDHHYRIHSGERPYKCPSCSATFSQSASRWLHYMRIHAGKTFVCEVCHRAFKSKQSLTLHQEIHSGKECLCQQCGKTFVGKLRLQAHLRNRCGSSSSIIKGCYTCKDCGMTFSYPSNLYRHKKGVHLRLKPHQCAICQKSFSQSNTLKAHLLTHPKSDV